VSVYFIKPIGMDGPIKIGSSCAPDQRRETLAFWSPFPLEIIAEVEGGGRLERQFHALFLPFHQRKEWFDPAPEIMAAVDQINAGTFDVSTLPAPIVLANVGRVPRSWTNEQRVNFKRSHAIRKMGRISGFHYRGGSSDDYLAAPHIHGRPTLNAESAVKRAEWLAKVSA
jgi:hypothetical protein